jgi:hypothetical protein
MTGSWPIVSTPGGDQALEEKPVDDPPAITETDGGGVDLEAAAESASPETGASMVLGQRGEPAIRTILGGELIAEEILEPPSSEASDV